MVTGLLRGCVLTITVPTMVVGFIMLIIGVPYVAAQYPAMGLSAASFLIASSLGIAGLVRGNAISFDGDNVTVAFLLVGMLLAMGVAIAMVLLPNLSPFGSWLRFVHAAAFVGLAAEAPRRISHLTEAKQRNVLTLEAMALAGCLALSLLALGLPTVVLA